MTAAASEIAQLARKLHLKSPSKNAAVHKAECVYSTDTEKSPDGLYINISTFESFGRELLEFDRHAQNAIYLHVTSTLVPLKPELGTDAAEDGAAEAKGELEPEEGVFKQKKLYDEVVRYELYSHATGATAPLEEAPPAVAEVCKAIIDHVGFNYSADELVWKEQIEESKYAKHLIQVEAPPKINYGQLTCQRCGADHNLWLNLSDGYIGCGRKNYDSGGCADGEEGAAIQHYQETGGVFPLAVKIGTITATSGDVYSYAPDEDTLVLDPYLAEHLAHFGVDVRSLKKTEKSTTQLEIEKNERHDWSEMNTADSQVEYGPGLIGLENLGNSCYMNSAVQLLAAVPEISSYFVEHYNSIATHVPKEVRPSDDVLLQFSKIVKALATSRVVEQQLELIRRYHKACADLEIEYTEPEVYKNFAVKPSLLKYAIGLSNPRFATAEQQDAEEFFSHLVNTIADLAPNLKQRTKSSCKIKEMLFFQYRQYIVCDALNKITYNDNEMHILCLPLHGCGQGAAGVNSDVPINLADCFANWAQEQEIEYFHEGQSHVGVITNALITLPKYLIVKLERFYYQLDGSSEKATNPVVVPPEGLRLETDVERECAGYSVECNTRVLKKAKKEVNLELLQSLMAMGFAEKLCRVACERAGSANIDDCVNWILANMDAVSQDSTVGTKNANEVAVNASVLMDLGYPLEQANRAAELFGDDVASAVDWLATADFTTRPVEKDVGHYEVLGVISHIGAKINTGHYVCHINRAGRWYTFNDSKVLRCDTPPTTNGYIYLFKRKESASAACTI
ncbi:ubiquitin carboxyl-terminal hydrolase, putative [Babesia caballi]|uniref:Ubiquitin carboxyl-terminal hydrolase n=1 Tax=Babesia caballi TaxID=5871 RepID=A0AAV4M2G8_BABCB|nr:ubiquitin carboxyl-terminal hydrolase, putative [Babesia caballi]